MTTFWPFWWLDLMMTSNGVWQWWFGPWNMTNNEMKKVETYLDTLTSDQISIWKPIETVNFNLGPYQPYWKSAFDHRWLTGLTSSHIGKKTAKALSTSSYFLLLPLDLHDVHFKSKCMQHFTLKVFQHVPNFTFMDGLEEHELSKDWLIIPLFISSL